MHLRVSVLLTTSQHAAELLVSLDRRENRTSRVTPTARVWQHAGRMGSIQCNCVMIRAHCSTQ
jgi:hypothetical protein